MMNEEDSPQRKVLFRVGLAGAGICAASGVCSWIDPFPLLSDGQGGWRTNPLADWVLLAGLLAGCLTVILAFFGKGMSRAFLIVSGLALLFFNCAAWLGNHR